MASKRDFFSYLARCQYLNPLTLERIMEFPSNARFLLILSRPISSLHPMLGFHCRVQPYLRRICSYLALGRHDGSQVVEEGILCKEGPKWREPGRGETTFGAEHFGHGNRPLPQNWKRCTAIGALIHGYRAVSVLVKEDLTFCTRIIMLSM